MPESCPETRASKGPQTLEAVLVNQEQLTLNLAFDECAQNDAGVQYGHDHRATWILLIYRGVNEVRAELSLPVSIGDNGKVNDWRERIMLKPIPRDPAAVLVEPPKQPDLDVEVKRRSA